MVLKFFIHIPFYLFFGEKRIWITEFKKKFLLFFKKLPHSSRNLLAKSDIKESIWKTRVRKTSTWKSGCGKQRLFPCFSRENEKMGGNETPNQRVGYLIPEHLNSIIFLSSFCCIVLISTIFFQCAFLIFRLISLCFAFLEPFFALSLLVFAKRSFASV